MEMSQPFIEMPKLYVPDFLKINISFLAGGTILWIIFILFFIVYVVIASVLLYHWHAYGMKGKAVLFAESLFIFVSVVLFTVSGLAIYFF